ncbi:MAG: hypothetical protein ACR65R_11505 [Methylomicrobium sp.]
MNENQTMSLMMEVSLVLSSTITILHLVRTNLSQLNNTNDAIKAIGVAESMLDRIEEDVDEFLG